MGEVRVFPCSDITMYGLKKMYATELGFEIYFVRCIAVQDIVQFFFYLVNVFFFFHPSSTPTLFFKLCSNKILSRVLSKHRSHWASLPELLCSH